MKELEQFFKNVERIANAMEERNNLLKAESEVPETKINDAAIASNVIAQQPAQQIPVAQIAQGQQVTPMQVTTAIPVSNTIVEYTIDQMSFAMGRAVDMGKMTDLQNILASFGVQALNQLPKEKYGELAMKLKGIGVEV